MARVNPPPTLRRPPSLAKDQAADAYLRQLEWILFQLWERTGGGDDIIDDSANQNVDTDALYGLFAQLDELEQELNPENNMQGISQPQEVVVASANHTTVGNETVICTTGVTVTLNATPDDLERVNIKRTADQIVIDGNGKQIDGHDTITVIRQYTTLDLIYTVETDSWSII